MPLEFGERTGNVDYIDWDEAVLLGIGAHFDESKNEWYLPLDGIFVKIDGRQEPIEKALVVFKRPEPTQISATVPMIAIARDSEGTADERLQTLTQSYRLPAEGAEQISVGGVLGWTAYETKEFERPYDFYYTFECWSRFRTVAQMLLSMLKSKFPYRGVVTVVDGLNNPRVYATYFQGVTELTNVASLVERICGFSLSIRIEAELTEGNEPYTIPAFTGTQTTTPLPGGSGTGAPGYQLVPGPGGYGLVPADINGIPLSLGGNREADSGPGGLYGTGKPIVRTGMYGRLK